MLAIHKKSEFLLPCSCCLQCFLVAALVVICLGLLDFQWGSLPYSAFPPADAHFISHSLQSCSWLVSLLTTPLSVSVPVMGSMSPWTPAGPALCTPGAARWPLCWAATKYARKWAIPQSWHWEVGQYERGRARLTLPHPPGHP